MITEDSIKHSFKVAKLLKELALKDGTMDIQEANKLFTLGLLHDIGYEFGETSNHAELGGNVLKQLNYSYWREVYYHGKSKSSYKSKILDLLNEADLRINPKGDEVSILERLKDVASRHGVNSKAYIEFKDLACELGLV